MLVLDESQTDEVVTVFAEADARRHRHLGLAQQQKHVSLYVNAVAEGGYLLAQYQGRLGSLKQGAAALTIPSLEKVNLEGLASLVDEAFATLDS